MLENLRQRNKIDFYLALVETTAGQDIFDFSRQLAHDWAGVLREDYESPLWLLLATDELVADPEESQTVVVLEAFLVTPPALDVSRARPWVTRWKFRWTSPIEDEMRVTPGLAACTFVCREG